MRTNSDKKRCLRFPEYATHRNTGPSAAGRTPRQRLSGRLPRAATPAHTISLVLKVQARPKPKAGLRALKELTAQTQALAPFGPLRQASTGSCGRAVDVQPSSIRRNRGAV